MNQNKVSIEYNDTVVRYFLVITVVWSLVGMLVGVLVAFMLNFWQIDGGLYLFGLNIPMEWLSFGRLRPLHTNAAIFAFVGNMMFAGVYYSTQRLVRARLASDILSWVHFWGWQLIIVAAAVTLPLGLTRGKEYAELIWPINIAVVLMWVVFAVNFFWTLLIRNVSTLYVAIWFYIATIVTVAMLYIVNHLSIPTSFLHSYPVFAGVQDALVQWWYGHNAVAFFLTTPILGIMYYFVPKAVNRPVYSYRLSVIHFWSLVFIYIWAGPHHLLNTALPQWLQYLGMLFSLMLWAPSWGGMLNGLFTMRGAWDKLRTDPVVKFFAAAITFYGMATFEGPLLSIKSVNALAHYSDWIIGHVHSGTLGWNGFMAAGMIYWLVPRLWKRPLHSQALANFHFWIGMIGILLYIASMWFAGITQGVMLNALNESGTSLAYANFLETLNSIRFMMLTRAVGGTFYFIGFVLMTYNVFKTIVGAEVQKTTIEVEAKPEKETMPWVKGFINAPIIYSTLGIFFPCLWMLGDGFVMLLGMFGTIIVVLLAIIHFKATGAKWNDWYEKLLANSMIFTVLVFVSVAIGGAIQIIPTVTVNKAENLQGRIQKLYTPLELAGRDIYISEGCYNCHSQMIRTMRSDVIRYGDYSRLGESIYDHPFQWGSRRTGPDLAREGGYRPNDWHYDHFMDPRTVSPGSNMPAYPWLAKKKIDVDALPSKISVLRTLNVPYPEWTDEEIFDSVAEQAEGIAKDLQEKGRVLQPNTQMTALIAYMQKLGAYEIRGDVASTE
ncbi:MAG: cytochrome-c oxidase, cbb3-type subunit I [Opitutales bacterium]|nr:cytochrome-c oxidase, cbb3-type subunit I [Opitutales bacterium]